MQYKNSLSNLICKIRNYCYYYYYGREYWQPEVIKTSVFKTETGIRTYVSIYVPVSVTNCGRIFCYCWGRFSAYLIETVQIINPG